jgi:hypothetical protein
MIFLNKTLSALIATICLASPFLTNAATKPELVSYTHDAGGSTVTLHNRIIVDRAEATPNPCFRQPRCTIRVLSLTSNHLNAYSNEYWEDSIITQHSTLGSMFTALNIDQRIVSTPNTTLLPGGQAFSCIMWSTT